MNDRQPQPESDSEKLLDLCHSLYCLATGRCEQGMSTDVVDLARRVLKEYGRI